MSEEVNLTYLEFFVLDFIIFIWILLGIINILQVKT